MATKQKQFYCSECDRKTLHQKEIFSGGMGCLLTIITGGLFLPIWLLADLCGIFSRYKCQQCGKSK